MHGTPSDQYTPWCIYKHNHKKTHFGSDPIQLHFLALSYLQAASGAGLTNPSAIAGSDIYY